MADEQAKDVRNLNPMSMDTKINEGDRDFRPKPVRHEPNVTAIHTFQAPEQEVVEKSKKGADNENKPEDQLALDLSAPSPRAPSIGGSKTQQGPSTDK